MGSRLVIGGMGGLFLLLSSVTSALADGPAVLDAKAMSARIDHLIEARWAEEGVKPAVLAGDAEFFRRLSLDLNGRIPSIIQLKDFLDDTRPDKRRIWVEELMRGQYNKDLFIGHMTNYWRTLFFSQSTNQQAQFIGYQIVPLLRRHLLESHTAIPSLKDDGTFPTYGEIVQADKPMAYHRLVSDILTSPQGNSFYQINNQPETIAGATARLFLGVKLECAQCHNDRSGGSWTREQFWQYAAFFTRVPVRGRPRTTPAGNASSGAPRIKIPDKEQYVEAKFLDNTEADWKDSPQPRQVLVKWMTASGNPFFARATVNRMWYYYIGTGITDPVDAMGTSENPPSHPQLLDELAEQFVAHNFDLKFLIRAIIGSKAYQLTSRKSHDTQDDERQFARMAVRGMSPEQLYDSILAATGLADNSPPVNPRFGFRGNTPKAEFLNRFTNTADKRTEVKTSILQALFLMNGKFMGDQIKNSPALATIQRNTSSPISRNVDELFLITLSRMPSAKERGRLVKYVESGGPGGSRQTALADVYWALLNSSEFGLNH